MNDGFVSFDDIWKRVVDAVVALETLPDGVDGIYLVRNLYGQVAVSVSDTVPPLAAARTGRTHQGAPIYRFCPHPRSQY